MINHALANISSYMSSREKEAEPKRPAFYLFEAMDEFAAQCRVEGGDRVDDSELLDIHDVILDEIQSCGAGGAVHGHLRITADKPELVIVGEDGKAIKGRVCLMCRTGLEPK